MDSGIVLLAGGVSGALVGVFIDRWLGRRSPERMSTEIVTTPAEPEGVPSPNVPEGMRRVLAVLPGAALVVGADNIVLRASPEAANLGMSQGARVDTPEIVALVAQVRRDGVTREEDLELRRPPLGRVAMQARVRVAPLSATAALVMIEDHSEAARVDAVRRDFVANVSHELKTPVGALSLLAEAVQSAPDDQEAVERFSARMLVESQRLTNVVNDLIDLSRLQSGDPLKDSKLVDVDHIVAEAVDSTKLIANSRDSSAML